MPSVMDLRLSKERGTATDLRLEGVLGIMFKSSRTVSKKKGEHINVVYGLTLQIEQDRSFTLGCSIAGQTLFFFFFFRMKEEV